MRNPSSGTAAILAKIAWFAKLRIKQSHDAAGWLGGQSIPMVTCDVTSIWLPLKVWSVCVRYLAFGVKLRSTCVSEERARAPVCCTRSEFSYDVSSV